MTATWLTGQQTLAVVGVPACWDKARADPPMCDDVSHADSPSHGLAMKHTGLTAARKSLSLTDKVFLSQEI